MKYTAVVCSIWFWFCRWFFLSLSPPNLSLSFLPTNIIAVVLEGSVVWVKVIDFKGEMEKRQRCGELYVSVRSDHLWKHRGTSICRRINRPPRSVTGTPLHCQEQFTWYPNLDCFFLLPCDSHSLNFHYLDELLWF